MLVLIEVTAPTGTTTRRLQQLGAEAHGRSHKKGHCCQQQQNSEDNKMPRTTTSMMMRQSQEANKDEDTSTTTMTTRCQRRQCGKSL